MIISAHRVWISEDGKSLVKDGHAKARVLFARVGQKLQPKEFERFPNAGEFFPVTEPVEKPSPKTAKK